MRPHLVIALVTRNIESPGARNSLVEGFYGSSRGSD